MKNLVVGDPSSDIPVSARKMSYQLFLDLDGVICDFVGGACSLHKKPNPYSNSENFGRYDIHKIWEISGNEFWEPMNEEFWAKLEPTEDARDILNLLSKYFLEEDICILTSPSLEPRCLSGKMMWIQEHFPSFQRRILIGAAKHFCSRPGAILLDDSESNVEKFSFYGGHGILYPRPWNRLHMTQEKKDRMIYLRNQFDIFFRV